MIKKEKKLEIVKKFQQHANDTASPQVQIAMLTSRLLELNEHFKTNKKDYHSKRGLMKLVGRRKRLLSYLHKKDGESYFSLIKELGIRK